MRTCNISTVNKTKNNAYEFTKDGKELRIECWVSSSYDAWFNDYNISLLFRVEEKIDGSWQEIEDKTLIERDEYARTHYPDEVKIVKEQLANLIKRL